VTAEIVLDEPRRAQRVSVSRHRGGLLVVLVALFALVLAVPSASAETPGLIEFEEPVLPGARESIELGEEVSGQYLADGVKFTASTTPVREPLGWSPFANRLPDLYRNNTIYPPGDEDRQVLYAYTCFSEDCSFDEYAAEIFGRLTTETSELKVLAGTEGGGPVELAGYNLKGEVVADDTVTVNTKVEKPLQIESGEPDIAYFSVARLRGGADGYSALEVGELRFEIPAKPPPPAIVLEQSALPNGPVGAQGSTASWTVHVQRFNGADEPIELHVSGLPGGVALTGGQTIASGSESTTLTFSISPSAPVVSGAPFSISATSPDVTEPPAPTAEDFYIEAALRIGLEEHEGVGEFTQLKTIELGPCSSASASITNLQVVPGSSTLAIAEEGDTAGLTATLSASSLARGSKVTLQLSSNGTGGAGEARYTITATDGALPTATATVVVERTGPTTAQGIWVTQGTQQDFGQLQPSGSRGSGDIYEGVSLVAGKTTVVRVYGDASGTPAGVPGAVALLYGYRNGKALPGSPLKPEYGPGTLADAHATREVVSDRELEGEANAYTFTLPLAWTSSGYADRGGSYVPGTLYPTGQTIQLVAKTLPYPGAGQVASCHTSDSFTLNSVKFNTVGLNYDNTIYPIALTIDGVEPPEPSQVFGEAEAALPIPNGYMGAFEYIGYTDISDIAHSSKSESEKDGEVLGRVTADFGNTEHAVGVTAKEIINGDTSGSGGASAVDGSGRPLTEVAHEIGHQFGLHHASNCNGGGENGQTAVAWPPDERGLLDGIGLNTTSEPYKFIYNGAEGYAGAYDFMSYCAHIGGGDPNDWLSPRNWQKLVEEFGITPSAASARRTLLTSVATPRFRRETGTSAVAALAQAHPSELRVIGFATNNGVHITNVGPLVGPTVPAAVDQAYKLIARGAGGRVLASVAMMATTGGHIDGVGPISILTGLVPSIGIQDIQVALNGMVMATRSRPARAPAVAVITPRAGSRVGGHGKVTVRWRATNPEHLSLTVAIDYSRNGGRTWRTIFAGPDSGHASVSRFLFTASRNARVRVRVNDGFNETNAISGRFTALGAPPKIAILSHFSGTMALAGDAPVQLAGVAVDQAGHVLSGRSLHWYDGTSSLGYGFAISAGPLPPGVNHIRLVARDSSGRMASATIRVLVAAVQLPGLTLEFPGHVSRHARKLEFRAAAATATALTVGRHTYQLSARLASFTLPIATGRTPLLLAVTAASEGVVTPLAVEVSRR
jgi:hypothetical protein